MLRDDNNTLSVSDILKNDPLVSDAACQNRAVFLIDIARKIIRGEEPNEKENEIIRLCNVLTQTKNSERHELNYIAKEVTEIEQLPDDYFKKCVKEKTKEFKLSSKSESRQKKIIVAFSKQQLASYTIEYLKNKTDVTLSEDYQLFSNMENLAYFKLEGFSIPILPIYLSAKMLLNYIVKYNIPFFINFSRIQADLDKEICIGRASFCYRSNNSPTLSETTLQEEEPVIIADIFSFKGSKYSCQSTFLTEDSFADCLQSLKAIGMLSIIMLAAASHQPYTKTAIKKAANDPMFDLNEPEISQDTPAINLNESSPAEFFRLRGVAKRLGFFENRVVIDHIYPGLRGPQPVTND